MSNSVHPFSEAYGSSARYRYTLCAWSRPSRQIHGRGLPSCINQFGGRHSNIQSHILFRLCICQYTNFTLSYNIGINYINFFFNTIFVSSHMYPENAEGTQVIVEPPSFIIRPLKTRLLPLPSSWHAQIVQYIISKRSPPISQFFSVTVCLSEISFHWDCLAQTNKWYNGIHWLW